MHVTAIVLAAGRGIRLKSQYPKPLVEINSQPIIIYSLEALSQYPKIKDIVVVANKKNIKEIISKIREYSIPKIKDIILGGKRRQDSAFNGLRAIDKNTDFILIHDAARPFIDKQVIRSLINEAGIAGAAVCGVPVKATIKKIIRQKEKGKIKFMVGKTLERLSLWETQTPQVFRKDLILEAYKRFGSVLVTDDAMLVEKLGAKVRVVLGSYNNIKITTPGDLLIAQAILKAQSVNRKAQD